MSKKLAIKGHPTRGKEVIELLGMMGGKSTIPIGAISNKSVYIIREGEIFEIPHYNIKFYDFVIFTLEEFLKKYPFKVGDKVIDVADGCPGIINEMKWDESVCDMKYCVAFGNGIDIGWYTNDTIKFYQSENSKDIVTTVNETQPKRDIYASEFMITHMLLPETSHNVNDKLEYKIIDGYEFDVVVDGKIILKPIKPEYPNTYEECCEVIGISRHDVEIDLPQPYQQKMFNLFKLRICRDAYWRLAGEVLGLGKPWEPDWDNLSTNHEFIKIDKGCFTYSSRLLIFPTKEMRDVFYDNFKDLIDKCKDFL